MQPAVTVITLTADELRRIIREELEAAQRAAPAPSPAPDALVPLAEAAEAVGCSPDTIRRMIQRGQLPDRRAGMHYRVRISEVEAAMRAPQRPAPVDSDAAAVAILGRRR